MPLVSIDKPETAARFIVMYSCSSAINTPLTGHDKAVAALYGLKIVLSYVSDRYLPVGAKLL